MTAAPNSYVARLLPLRLPRVCVAVTDSDPAALVDKAEALIRDNTFLEFRLDYLPRPRLLSPESSASWNTIPTSSPSPPAGVRPAEGSSRVPWPPSWTFWARPAHPAASCSISSCRALSSASPNRCSVCGQNPHLILSYHDFRATKNLEQTLEKMVKIPADFYKIVSTATTLYDNVTMMKFLEKFGDRHSLVGLCMGEQGIISRLLGVRAGSVFHLRRGQSR